MCLEDVKLRVRQHKALDLSVEVARSLLCDYRGNLQSSPGVHIFSRKNIVELLTYSRFMFPTFIPTAPIFPVSGTLLYMINCMSINFPHLG